MENEILAKINEDLAKARELRIKEIMGNALEAGEVLDELETATEMAFKYQRQKWKREEKIEELERELEKMKTLLNDALIQISRKNAEISRGKWEQIKAEIEDLNRDAPEDVIFNTFDCKNCGPSIWKGNLDENGQETGGCCFNCGDPNY